MELMDYLNSAKSSLFRFEKLQYYDEGDNDAGLKNFLEKGELPLTEMQEWFDFIQKKTGEKVIMQRVRYVDFPQTDYTKYEIALHRKSIEMGDDIRIILEEDLNTIDFKFQDFWLIDNETTLLMNYDEKGVFIGFDVVKDPEYSIIKDLLLEKSIPLNKILNIDSTN